jgi:hypothetical protein
VQQKCLECGCAIGYGGHSPLSLGDLGPLCETCHARLKCRACDGGGMVPVCRTDSAAPGNGGQALTVCPACKGEAWRRPAEETVRRQCSKFPSPHQKGTAAMPDDATPGPESEHERTIFGENLRQARKAAGLKEADVLNMTGLAEPHLVQIENGTASLCVDTMAMLSEAVGKPLWSLLKPRG